MRRALLSLLIGAVLLAGIPAQAFWQSRDSNYNLAAGGAPVDPATTAWVNAVVAVGGTVSTTQKGFVNTLIVGLKTGNATNYFTSCDRIWLLAAENTQQASIDIVSLATLTPHSSPTFAANQGYTGDGSASYLDLGFQSGTNYTAAAASISAYDRTNRTTGNTFYAVGANDATNYAIIIPGVDPTFSEVAINGPSAAQFFATTSTAQGFFLLTRTSVLASFYKNGSSSAVATKSLTGGAVPTQNQFVLADNFQGSAAGFSTDQIAEVSFCASFTGTQSSQFQGLINAYMTSVGANVY